MCVSHTDAGSLVVVSLSALALTLFLHLLFCGVPRGRDLIETSLLGMGVLRSLSLCLVPGWGSLE